MPKLCLGKEALLVASYSQKPMKHFTLTLNQVGKRSYVSSMRVICDFFLPVYHTRIQLIKKEGLCTKGVRAMLLLTPR